MGGRAWTWMTSSSAVGSRSPERRALHVPSSAHTLVCSYVFRNEMPQQERNDLRRVCVCSANALRLARKGQALSLRFQSPRGVHWRRVRRHSEGFTLQEVHPDLAMNQDCMATQWP